MELRITSSQVLKILEVLSWIIFIGLGIDAGSFIFNGIYSVGFNPHAADYFKLSPLYGYDQGHFLVQLLLMTIVGCLKATIFYLIIRTLRSKSLDMALPFSTGMGRFLSYLSYLSIATGFFSSWGVDYADWLSSKGVAMPDIRVLHLGGADVWLFMGMILFVIAQIFKRGIEIQAENELTI